jgi:hypothetical protein
MTLSHTRLNMEIQIGAVCFLPAPQVNAIWYTSGRCTGEIENLLSIVLSESKS